MPKRRQTLRKKKENLEVLTPGQLESLLDGHEWFDSAFYDDDSRRQAWELHRAGLMEYWLQDPCIWLEAGNRNKFGTPQPGGPGTRPVAWWEYDSPDEPFRAVSPFEQIEVEILKRGEPQYSGSAEFPQSLYYRDREETSVSYLHRLKLLSPAELEYLSGLSSDTSDWYFLQRNGWLTAHGRREWFKTWCRNLTDKGVESRRTDLLYLQKMGLSPIITRQDMGPEGATPFWKLAEYIILTD